MKKNDGDAIIHDYAKVTQQHSYRANISYHTHVEDMNAYFIGSRKLTILCNLGFPGVFRSQIVIRSWSSVVIVSELRQGKWVSHLRTYSRKPKE